MLLATASEYFSTMFTTDMMDKNQKQIEIKEVTGESLKSLVNYCYTGQIEINSRNVGDLLASASMMRFGKIEDECREFLEKQLNANWKTSFIIHLLAQRYSFTELAKNSLKNFCENFDILSKTPDFNEIDFGFMERILDSDENFDVNEERIFEAAMKWVDFDRSERQQFIPNILKLIRLTQIHPTYLFEKIEPICESRDCLKLIMTALHCIAMPQSERLRLLPTKQTTTRPCSLRMLIIGGNMPFNDISMESYCSRSKKWISHDHNIFTQIDDTSRLAVIDETVYVTGKTVFCFDLHTLKLSHLAPMITARRYHSIAVSNKDLYVIGGRKLNRSDRLSSIERYDLSQNKWSSCKPMPEARLAMGVAVLNDYLYVIGGYDDDMRLDSVEQYSPSNNSWSSVKSMKNRRSNPGVGVLDGKIYVVGGFDGNSVDFVECYDPNTDMWTTISSLLVPRAQVSVAVYENELFAIGGENNGMKLSVVERYDANENKWITIEPLNNSISLSAVTIIRRN